MGGWHECSSSLGVGIYMIHQSDRIERAEREVGPVQSSDCVCAQFLVGAGGEITDIEIVSATSAASADRVRAILEAASPLEEPPDSAQCISDTPVPMSFGENSKAPKR